MNVVGAVEGNRTAVLRLLVAVPGSVNNKELHRALLLACSKGYTEAVQILLEAGVDPDAQDQSGNTALKLAVDGGHADVVQALIEAKCTVNQRLGNRGTALHVAAARGQHLCVARLVAAGAKLDALDSQKNTPLMAAARDPHRGLAAMRVLVLEGCKLDQQNTRGMTALHLAAHKAIGVELLLQAGADPNLQDNDGNAPIHLASVEGFDPVVASLTRHGCKTDMKNAFGKTALHYLAMKNHHKGIDKIVRAGGNVNPIDNNNHTPLWYAINHNRPAAVKALLRANCAVDPIIGPDGQERGGNPLETALQKNLFGMGKLLVLAGCKVAPLYPWLQEHAQDSNSDEESDYVSDYSSDSSTEEDRIHKIRKLEAIEWFEHWLHSPHSLRQLCRISIRNYLGTHPISKESQLPLPPALKDYITLREMDDHDIPDHVL